MSHHPWLRAVALAAALSGCSSVQVQTQYDPAAEFARYRSYAWLATAPGAEQAAAIRDPAVRTLVVTAIDRELAKKKLTRTTPDAGPDFFVSVLGLSQNRIEVRDYGYAVYGGVWVAPAVDVSQYRQGTLLLDFVDARTRQLFWRGTATGALESPGELQQIIEEAARRMLEAYPPRAP